MSEITQEEIREFWEWCGFTQAGGGWKEHIYKYPLCPPEGILDGHYAPLPQIDLNNLFGYGVYGKLTKVYRNWKSLLHDWVDGLTGDMEKDTASLFRILQEVMRNE